MARIAAALASTLAPSAYSGPLFYRDVIVLTDPNRRPPVPARMPPEQVMP